MFIYLFFSLLVSVIGGTSIDPNNPPTLAVFDLNAHAPQDVVPGSTSLNLCYNRTTFENQEVTIEFARPLVVSGFADITDLTSVNIIFSVSMRPSQYTPVVVLTQHDITGPSMGYHTMNVAAGASLSSTTSSTPNTNTNGVSSAGPIASGVIGALVGIAILAGLAF